MWELDYKESWLQKNWCFWTVVLEKTLESPSDCKEIQPSPSYRKLVLKIYWKDWCWSWNSRTLATWCEELTHLKRPWWRQEKGTTEDEMIGWHHRLDGHEFEWTPGVRDGQRGLVCCQTQLSNWTELNWTELRIALPISTRPSFPLSRSLPSGSFHSLLSFSIRGQTEWKPQSQKTNQSDHMDHTLV